MKTPSQDRIIMALSAINLMSNTLTVVNLQMGMFPGGEAAQEFQKNRELFLESIAKDLADVSNKLGDFLNDMDAVDENMMAITDPLFEIINGGSFEEEDDAEA